MVVLRVDSRDLSPFLRVAIGEGLQPSPFEHISPQFGGSPAFSEGATFTGDAVSNAERVFPLILSADSTADLHQLIRDIEADLVKGAVVEFATDDAEQSSFFDLEAGRLEIDYEHWIVRAGHLRATLRCWTRPFANTGTARMVASLRASQPVAQFSVTGVMGDVPALTNLEVRVGSQVASSGRVIGYGVHPSASYSAIRGPSSVDFTSAAAGSASLRNDAGAVGTQYLDARIGGASVLPIVKSYLTPPAAHGGRHRVFAIMRIPTTIATGVYHARDRFGAALGPTQTLKGGNLLWHLVDFGEVQVVARDPRQEPVATQYVELVADSPITHINRFVYMPLEFGPGMMQTAGYSQINTRENVGSALLGRSFWRFESHPERRAIRANASVFENEHARDVRGNFPMLPPVGSPGPSGPAQMVVLAGEPEGFSGEDFLDARLDVVERWKFLRP